jgi:5'-nucleotidase
MVARQCTRPWKDSYEKRTDPRGRTYYWNDSIFQLGPTEADTDVAALRDGYMTVTPLMFDLTDKSVLNEAVMVLADNNR